MFLPSLSISLFLFPSEIWCFNLHRHPISVDSLHSTMHRRSLTDTGMPDTCYQTDHHSMRTRLCYAQSNDEEEPKQQSTEKMKRNTSKLTVRRTHVKGVSVSPIGFVMLYQTPNNMVLPFRVTSSSQDYHFTTTPESLTLCQLLSGVDMAGAILNPDMLKHIVGLHCSMSYDEESRNEIIVEDELGLDSSSFFELDDEESGETESDCASTAEFVYQFLSTTLGHASSYEDANDWQKSRCVFPKLSLDSVRIDLPFMQNDEDDDDEESDSDSLVMIKDGIKEDSSHHQDRLLPMPYKFTLECRVDGDKALDIDLYSESSLLQKVFKDEAMLSDIERSDNILLDSCFNYDKETSAAFLALSLSMRYRCPVVITSRALDAISDIQDELIQSLGNAVCIKQPSISNDTNGEQTTVSESEDDLMRLVLPQWRSLNALQSQSQRVVENIEQSFKVTKLQSALNIAVEKGDEAAAEKIQNEINRLLGNTDEDIDDNEDER